MKLTITNERKTLVKEFEEFNKFNTHQVKICLSNFMYENNIKSCEWKLEGKCKIHSFVKEGVRVLVK